MIERRSDVNARQANDRGVLLQQAADANHAYAARCERWREFGSLLLAGVGLVAVLLQPLRAWGAAAGAVWAVTSFVFLGPASKRASERAAAVQDQFDTWAMGLDPSPHAAKWLRDSDLIRWARRSRQDIERFKTWYPNVEGLPGVLSALSCQRANLDWDKTLRRRYADRLTLFAVAVPVVGLAIGLALNLSTRALSLGYLVPTAPAVLLAAQGARAQREIAASKAETVSDVEGDIERALATPSHEDLELWGRARQHQDRLYDQRRRTERVLGRVYEQHRDDDEQVMRQTVDELRRRLATD